MKNQNKKNIIALAIISVFLLTEVFPFFNESLNKMNQKEVDESEKEKLIRASGNFTYISKVDQTNYPFNAKGECYILAKVNGTDYTSFQLDGELYNVSYGLNSFPKDFGEDWESHLITIDSSDLYDEDSKLIFEWLCVEPLYLAENNTTVNLLEETIINFDGGGPLTILIQPNFSYNYLYLELLEFNSKSIVLKNIFDPEQGFPEIDSLAYSSLIEDGNYISFDIDLEPGAHSIKILGNGTIDYKILVNLDWDNDLLNDVDEIQRENYYNFDPTIPDIWGFFEKGNSMLTNFSDGINEGEFSFYVPDSLKTPKFLFIDMLRGDFSEFNINGDGMTLKDMVFSTDYIQSSKKSQFYGEINTGWNDIQYKFNSDKSSIIFFRINSERIPVIDYQDLLDTDGDNLKDFVEVRSGLDPYKSDTDDDGIPDSYDGSPLSYLVLDKSKMCQIVIPHNESRNTFINVMIKKPFPDYSTYLTPRLWRNAYNVSIYLVMRLFGNSTIIRDDLVNFWKGDNSHVESYSLVDDYNCSGVGDAIPSSYDPENELTFITGNPSNKTFDFEIIFPKGHPAKNDNALDIRFDFVWLVSYFNETSGESEILHYYEMEEDIILLSITRRETDNVTYTLASPDSMIEHQIIWNLAQNSKLGSFSEYKVDDDIVGSGFVDYLEMPSKVIEDRESNPILRYYNATYGFENEAVGTSGTSIDFIDRASISTGCSLTIASEIDDHYKVLDFHDNNILGHIVDVKNEIADKVSGTVEFWWRTTDASDYFTIFLNDGISTAVRIYIEDDQFKYFNEIFPQTARSASDNTWYHHKIVFDCTTDRYDWYIDGVLEAENVKFFSYPPNVVAIDSMEFTTLWQDADYHNYIDAVGYSWDENYEVGDNTVPICSENEVLYVTGLQSNFDILNKINIIENIPDPSFEVNFSGEYEALFTFCSISNDVSRMSNIFNQESKTCYLISWHNYTQNGIEDYKQRVTVQDYPISLKLLNFSHAYVLKISNAFGNEIPKSQIPSSINDPLHEKIILKNQTLIENKNEDYVVPTIVFVEDEDEIKIIRDYRLGDVIRADLFFTETPISGAFKINKLLKIISKTVSQLTDSFINTYKTFLGTYSSIIEKISSITTRYWNSKKYQAIISTLKHLLNEEGWIDPQIIIEILNKYKFLRDDIKISSQFRNQLKELDNGLNDIYINIKKSISIIQFKSLMAAGIILSAISFGYNLYNIFFGKSEGDLKEDINRILTASLGVVISIISLISIIRTWNSFRLILSYSDPLLKVEKLDSIQASMKFSAKIVRYLGWAVAIFNMIFDIIQAVEIMDKDLHLALYLIFRTILINFVLVIGMDILLTYAFTIGILTSKETFGLSLLISLLIFLLSWIPLPRPSFEVTEDGTEVVLPMDNIKRHGSLEVNDDITIQLRLKNTGDWNSPPLHFILKARFKDSDSTWVGDWTAKDARYYIQPGSSTTFIFERELEVPVVNLTAEIDFDVYAYTVEWGTSLIYDKIEELNFNTPVLENYIASFFKNTVPLEPQYYLETLDLMLRLAMKNYLWKDANDLLNSIQEIEPNYGQNINIPVNVNLGTDLSENIIVMDTATNIAEFNFPLILEGDEYPIVTYNFKIPDGFSIASSEITQALNLNIKFNISANNPFEFAGVYYLNMTVSISDTIIYFERIPFRIPLVEDFQFTQSNIITETTIYGNYTASIDFLDDVIGEKPAGWEGGFWEDTYPSLSIISEMDGHNNVFELETNDFFPAMASYDFNTYYPDHPTVGTVELWIRKSSEMDNNEYPLYIGFSDDSGTFAVVLRIDLGNNGKIQASSPGSYNQGFYDICDGFQFKLDTWYHFRITFDYSSQDYDLYINGILEEENIPFEEDTTSIDSLYLGEWGFDSEIYSSTMRGKWYIDAIGIKWDSKNIIENYEYQVGDNMYRTDTESGVYGTPVQLKKGDIVNIEYKTNSLNEVLMNLLNNDVVQATYSIGPIGSPNDRYKFDQIIIKEDISFDQIEFSVYQYSSFEVTKLSIIDAGLIEFQRFNPLNFTNNGNIPEFISFSFSGVPFENINQSLNPDEFIRTKQIMALLPNTFRMCEFDIIIPSEPISNLLWRGIIYSKCGTNEIYNIYIDSFDIDGIYVDSPKNITYNIFGTSNVCEDGILLNIIPEKELLWTAYSLDGKQNITFQENAYIPIPKSDGIHKIQVFGKTLQGISYKSDIKYFTINYPINIISPENKTYIEPMNGYYPATYGFENDENNMNPVGWEVRKDEDFTIIQYLDSITYLMGSSGDGNLENTHVDNSDFKQINSQWVGPPILTDFIHVQLNINPEYSNRDFKLNIHVIASNNQDVRIWVNGEIIDESNEIILENFLISNVDSIRLSGDYWSDFNIKIYYFKLVEINVEGVESSGYVIEEIDNHKGVLKLHNERDGGIFLRNYFSSQTKGTIEYWLKNSDNSHQLNQLIGYDYGWGAEFIGIHLTTMNNKLRYFTDTWHDICDISNNEWYHIKIDFDCDIENYIGLSHNSFNISINDEQYGPYDFEFPLMDINFLEFNVGNSLFIYDAYVDAIGYSWDPDYSIGDNRIEGLYIEALSIIQLQNLYDESQNWLFTYSLDDQDVVPLLKGKVISMPENGLHSIIFNATNSFGHDCYSEKRYFTISQDFTPPDITNAQLTSDSISHGNVQNIRCDASDPSGVQLVNAYIEHPDENIIAIIPMTKTTGNTYEGIWITSSNVVDTCYVDICAIDNSYYHNEIVINNALQFTVIDTTAPSITNVQVSNNPLELGIPQEISCIATDCSGISSISAYIQDSSGSTIDVVSMENTEDNLYEATWTYSTLYIGTFFIDIQATDASINHNSIYIDNIISFNTQDTVGPNIYDITISNNPLYRFDIQTITCTIEDFSGIQSATVAIQLFQFGLPEIDITTLQMNNIGGNTYQAQWDPSDAGYGIYLVDIYAVDSSVNQNPTYINNAIGFILIEPPPPTIDITSPNDGATVSYTVTIRAQAASEAGITKVQFKIDNILKHEDTNGANGWTYYWDSRTVSNGGHTITCKAYDSLGRTVSDSISVNVQNGGGGGGGCPILSLYDGEQYITEGLLDIHNLEGKDVIYYHTLINTPLNVNNRYLLRLTEHYKTISHIDNVKLYGRLQNGRLLHLPLISAIHSQSGQIRQLLWFSDDRRVDVLGADYNYGMSEWIDLMFFSPQFLEFTEFIFVIEGNNMLVK